MRIALFRHTSLALVAAALFSQSGAIAAPAEDFVFDVPGGALEQVIRTLSEQARASGSIDLPDAAGTRVPGLSGRYTLREALISVLRDTPYDVDISSEGRIRIVRRNDGAQIVVIGTRRRDFVLDTDSLLTRTHTPLRQTPATIDSVTEEVLQSQNALSVGEALRNIPGVSYAVGMDTTPKIGAFSTENVIFVNGLRASPLSVNAPITDVESVQVLKGPAAILTGSEVAGGVINLVPKRATGRRITDFSVGLGSEGQRIVGADLSRTLSAEQGVYGRLVLLHDAADRQPGGGRDPRQTVFNPILGLRQGDLKIDASLQVYRTDTPLLETFSYDAATKAYTPYGDTVSDHSHRLVESTRLSYNVEKKLADLGEGSLSLRYRGLVQKATEQVQLQAPLAVVPGLGALGMTTSSYSRQRQVSQYVDLYAQFSTGRIEHQLVAGFNHADNDGKFADLDGGIGPLQPGSPLLPVPSGQPRAPRGTTQYNYFLQDQMTWGPWHLLLGLNKTHFKDSSSFFDGGVLKDNAPRRFDKLMPNLGLVLDVAPWTSVYYSFSNAFIPVSSTLRTADGSSLPPTFRRQHEVGVKAGFLDDRLTVNLSASRFSTDHEVRADPMNPAFSLSAPGIEGHNLELSVAGSVTPSFRLLAGYVQSKAEYKSDYLVGGVRFQNAGFPEQSVNVWALKSFTPAEGHQLELGVGGNYSRRFTAVDLLQGLYVDIDRPFVQANVSAGYSYRQYRLNLTVDNVFDRRNYQPFGTTSQIAGAAPRTTRLVLTTSF